MIDSCLLNNLIHTFALLNFTIQAVICAIDFHLIEFNWFQSTESKWMLWISVGWSCGYLLNKHCNFQMWIIVAKGDVFNATSVLDLFHPIQCIDRWPIIITWNYRCISSKDKIYNIMRFELCHSLDWIDPIDSIQCTDMWALKLYTPL